MLGLIVLIAIEAILCLALTSLGRVGQHDGAVVQQVLDLTVEDTALDVDILCTGSLYV